MKKFSITFKAAPGEVLITYDEDLVLTIIDATSANLKPNQIKWLKAAIPEQLIDAKKQLVNLILSANNAIEITQTSFDVSFDLFWESYNHKFNKKRAEALYNKLSYAKKLRCINSIKHYDNFLKWQKFERAKMDADTYLRNEAWENDWKNG
jgi:hypothetical protein